ncbi:uncharacterized protein LOC113315537 [Papaver somniferum]|uniref:uncharacterized protein LOC113315537 n=1 Tax=Papaver somniferum TaxID=3469 RepID=UPI000E6F4FB7|nr:uncharacterized protein LOC113315537 [Papaver somniferum]
MGKVNYIRCFIPGLAQLVASFTPLLKKGASFIWTATQQEAFRKIQRILSSPSIMKSPVQGKPLCLYTAFSDTAVGALLAQEDDEGIERLIYYFSRILRDVELKYPKAEKACLALIHSIQKFRHYLFSNKVVLMSKSDPAKFLLSKTLLMGRTAKWLLQISELYITCASPRAIKGKAVADLLAAFPGEGTTGLHEDLPGEFPDISVVEEEVWLLYFDGFATPSSNTGGAGVVLVSPYGEVFSHSFKLDFQCTNNSTDNNKHADCLVTMASKLKFEGLEETLTVKRRTVESTWLSQYIHRDLRLANYDHSGAQQLTFSRKSQSQNPAKLLHASCVPKHIITDNCTPFVNKQVRELLEEYGIKQVFSTVYNPQGNGQAESTNKTLIWIISRTVHDNPREWHDQLCNTPRF